jgi:hypothetical protein
MKTIIGKLIEQDPSITPDLAQCITINHCPDGYFDDEHICEIANEFCVSSESKDLDSCRECWNQPVNLKKLSSNG